MKTKCHMCESKFKNLSNHWEQSRSCNFPKLSKEQNQIIKGIVMGDGCITRPGKNPQLILEMVNKKYLKYISSKLNKYGTEVKLHKTAKQSAKEMRERDFRPNAKEENYQNSYRMSTRTTPQLNEFAEWYGQEGKKFPEKIKITPITLKHWFVCDGTYSTHGGADRIEISAVNEKERFNKIVSSFQDIGLEARVTGKTIYFSNSETNSVFDYMGEPVPGFKRKWP